MTREELINAMPIIKAFINGETVQYKGLDHEWKDLGVNDLDLDDFVESAWRTKPEPKYRPFKDAIECWTEMRKHKPFSILKDKKDGHRIQISSISDGINSIGSSLDSSFCFDFKYRMDSCTFDDGTPFGVKVEE